MEAEKRERTSTFHKAQCLSFIQKLWNADSLTMFHHPVSATEVPDYCEVIKNPIDLSAIKQKIEEEKYEQDADVEADVALMIANALEYNVKHSPWYEQAKKFRHQYLQLAKQSGMEIDDDTSFIPKKKAKDDESTLRLAEAKVKEKDVIGALKKESEMSLEELRDKYARKKKEDGEEKEEEEEIEFEEDEEDDDDDGEDEEDDEEGSEDDSDSDDDDSSSDDSGSS